MSIPSSKIAAGYTGGPQVSYYSLRGTVVPQVSFNSVAAAARVLSSVHTLQCASSAEASRCMSIQPRPRPASFRSAIRVKTSSCSTIGVAGNAPNRFSNSSRLRSLPQASSPITNRWQKTLPPSSNTASRSLPCLRCSIQTDVSTNVITLLEIGVGESA